MESERWQRLQHLFDQALALPAADRAPFVASRCAGDAELERELKRLLAGALPGPDPMQDAVGRAAADWARSRRDARAGERLGPWRIVAHLADGGMGAVYRGERADGRYEQAVAIKLLNPALMSAENRARLEQERQILARLQHPGIARLLDGGETGDGMPYLVMEFVDGLPIDRWCRERARDLRSRLQLFVRVCRAVDHAHRNLVVHRDLKPGNILVDRDGAPRLLDFGIAKWVEAQAGVTASGERMLTPSHASPEQVSGGAITTATDIYALGVLLYDLLTGRLPHAAASGSAAALARAIVETDPPRPSTAVGSGAAEAAVQQRGLRLTPQRLARELAGDLDNIVLMALRKEPDRRYATAAELADDIERHLSHLPVRARPDTLAYRGAKFVRRHPVAVPASAVAAVAAVAAAALFTWRLADERDHALASEARARRAADFTASVLERTGALADAEREVSVGELLDRAAERVETELTADPALATRMRSALGQAYSSWGAYERAMRVLKPALAEARARGTGGEREVGELMLQLGMVTHDLGRLEESLRWAREAEALLRRVGSAAQQGRALRDLALALNGLRRRSEAEPLFKEALAKLREVHRRASGEAGDHDDIAWLLNNYAWCLHAMGRLDEAQPLYEQALAMQQRLGTAPAERLQTQNNLAGVHFDRGELARAGALWQEVLTGYESVFGAGGHAAVARAQNMVALVAIERGRFDEAARLSAEAVATNRRLVGDRHRWTASTLQTHGVALLGQGRLAEAEQALRRVLAVRREVLPPGHVDNAGARLALARLALARGRPADAEREARAALALIEGLRQPDRAPHDRALWTLATAIARQGRLDEAHTVAAQAVERMRATLPASHWRRRAVEAASALPPFTAEPPAGARAAAAATAEALAVQLGPDAPLVRELRAQVAALR